MKIILDRYSEFVDARSMNIAWHCLKKDSKVAAGSIIVDRATLRLRWKELVKINGEIKVARY